MQEKLENSLNKFSSTCFLKATQIPIPHEIKDFISVLFGISDDKYISICKSKYFHEIHSCFYFSVFICSLPLKPKNQGYFTRFGKRSLNNFQDLLLPH